MDTSQEYIKMRLAAVPDMGRGDTSLTGRITQMFGNDAVMDEYGNYYAGYGSLCFKLERQDQLQEMVDCVRPTDLINSLENEISTAHYYKKYYLQFTSMEQLWLAFLLSEKYNKCWDGERWIFQGKT